MAPDETPEWMRDAPEWVRDGLTDGTARAEPEYRILWSSEPGGWSTVTHGPELPFTFDIKIGRRGRQLSLTGLRIDLSERKSGPRQVTSRTLRDIRVGRLLDQLADQYREPSAGLGSDYEPSLWFWHEMVEVIDRTATELPPVEAPRQGRPPSREQLRRFVGLYASHLRAGRRNAMTRATTDAGMARSTGYRWFELARQEGLLEGLEDEE